MRPRRRPGTGTSPRCGPSLASAGAAAGCGRRSRTGSSVAESRSIGPRRFRLPSLTGCGGATTLRLREKALWRLLYETAARAQGVAVAQCPRMSSWRTSALVCAPRAAISMAAPAIGLGTSAAQFDRRPRPGPVFLADRRPAPARAPPPPTAAPTRGARGCPTAAPRSCSQLPLLGGRFTSCITPRSPISPRPKSVCRC